MQNFSDITVSPPRGLPRTQITVAQAAANSNPGRIGFNRKYPISTLIHLALIIFEIAVWITAAAVPKPTSGTYYLTESFASTRSAILFFSILGCVLSAVLVILIISNMVNFSCFSVLPWILIILIINSVLVIPTFILSVVAAVKESEIKTLDIKAQELLNTGAFAACAFFGFVCTLLYAADIVLQVLKIKKDGIKAKVPSI